MMFAIVLLIHTLSIKVLKLKLSKSIYHSNTKNKILRNQFDRISSRHTLKTTNYCGKKLRLNWKDYSSLLIVATLTILFSRL